MPVKTGAWSNEALENAMNSITDQGMSIREASRVHGIPTSSVRDHLYGKTVSRQRGIRPTLAAQKEKKIVDYLFKM